MRIRKNAKVSPLLFASHASAEENLQPHVCQLNQNPWDVISFGPDSSQWEAEESFYGGSLGDSIGALESVASMMDSGQHKAAEMVGKMEDREPAAAEKVSNSKELENDKKEEEEEEGGKRSSSLLCQKNDGKGWHCKKRAKPGHSYCNHHLSLLKFHHDANNNSHRDRSNGHIASNNKAHAAASGVLAAGTRRTWAKAKRGSSNPNEFYYYCGFGPRWGRKRAKNEKEEPKIGEDRVGSTTITSSIPPPTHHTTTTPQSSTSQFENKEIQYVDDDDGDEDDFEDGSSGGDSCRKRMRKPIKARSLKSLM